MNDGDHGAWTAGDPPFAIACERAAYRTSEAGQAVATMPWPHAEASTASDDLSGARVTCRGGQISVSAPGVTIVTTIPPDQRAALVETRQGASGKAVARTTAEANAAGRSAAQLITVLALMRRLDAILDRA